MGNTPFLFNQVVIIQRQAPTLITNTQCYDILPFPNIYVGTNIVFKILNYTVNIKQSTYLNTVKIKRVRPILLLI